MLTYNTELLQEAWRTSDAPIGKYIINESFDPNTVPDKMELKKDPQTGKPIGRAIFQSGNTLNRNGRIYDTNDLIRETTCNRTQELIRTKNMFCEAGHPIDTSLQRQSTIDWRNSNCKILSFDNNGNDIGGLFTPSNTQLGKAFQEDLLEGVIPAFSLRALGSIRQTRLGAQVTDLRLITYDQVIYPSHSNAYMTELLRNSVNPQMMESAILVETSDSRIIPIEPLTESAAIKDFIMFNSNNIKYINDYFGTKFESVKVTPNGTKVTLAEDSSNNKIIVDLENYVHCELMNYCQKINELYKM